jgi:hypothetical protein
MRSLNGTVNRLLPLTAEDFEFGVPWFTIFSTSPKWSLAVACDWTVEGPSWKYSWEDEKLADLLPKLVASRLLRIEISEDLVDPVFYFEGDLKLSLQADTDEDPWVLRLPGLDTILVGRMTRDEDEDPEAHRGSTG